MSSVGVELRVHGTGMYTLCMPQDAGQGRKSSESSVARNARVAETPAVFAGMACEV